MLFPLFFFLVSLSSAAAAPPQVRLGNTTVTGRAIPGYSVESFRGIPYAEPPIGPLRFETSVLLTALASDTLDASNFGKSCLQPGMAAELVSEDCLTVNVFRPAGVQSNALLPVMFWTYGGGFYSGGSAQYDASALVARSVARGTPIIYVSFNYRLGPLGFPQGTEALQRGSLNLGLRDQIVCLEWVQLFVRAFGGDASKVTLFGQSAGSIMQSILLLHDISRLARAAIFESGHAATTALFPASRGDPDWQNFVGGTTSCRALQNTSTTFGCLQNVSEAEILAGWAAAAGRELFTWTPVLDGPGGLLPSLPSSIMAKEGFSMPLPFMTGTNLDEGTIFTPHCPFNDQIITNLIIANFSPPIPSVSTQSDLEAAAAQIVALYPNNPASGSGNASLGLPPQFKRTAAIEGDISFQSQRRMWSQTAAARGVKAFAYMFTQPQTQAPPSLGVYHGSEVRFVYGGVGHAASNSDSKLSGMMVDYWVSFATSMDPNDGLGTPRPQWDAYTSDNPALMQLNGENTAMIPDDYRQNQIQYIMDNSAVFHH
ncbi:extracellular triacylglycerol lipase precursor [Mycena albidolilacea]|uniref:Carboxylic ester hydrolase n=1 Tax=Mycena albidolilacea TaxID=1033008 RepID=A0AAD7ELL1_9AGAR|nr:extracellular triacylglycerol lipase precursor [Mycena albidolilacea]